MPVDVIEALILQRDAARERKDFDAADGFRDALRTAGVKVDDRNGGWACKDGRSGKQLPGGGFAATTANTNTNTNAKANTVPATAAAAVSSAGSGSAERSHYGAWEGYGLDEVLLKSLRRLGFSAPTTVQSMCLSASIAGRKDVAAAAPTGSGKTLAFGLPIMHQLLLQARGAAQKEGGDADVAPTLPAKPSAICIAPTRELALQVAKHLRAVAAGSLLERRGTIVTLVGGMAEVKQRRLLSFAPKVVVATPGRLYDLIEAEAISLANVRFVVLDEADHLSAPNSFPSLPKIFEKITSGGRGRQLFIFSATLTLDQPGSRLKSMVEQLGMDVDAKRTKVVNLSQSGDPASAGAMAGDEGRRGGRNAKKGGRGMSDSGTVRLPATLRLLQLRCIEAHKAAHLYYFYTQNPGRTLIFCNAISVVQSLTDLLNMLKVPAFPLHGKMQQRQRLKNLDRFVADANGVIVATDVAARGLDVNHLDHVVHFHVPTEASTFVHRSGRTARAGRKGTALALLAPVEIDRFRDICEALGADCDKEGRSSLMKFEVERKRMRAISVRVDLAVKLQKLQVTNNRAAAKRGWLEQMAKDADLAIDEEEDEEQTVDAKSERAHEMSHLRKELRRALKTPLDRIR